MREEESRGLVEKIAEFIGRAELPPDASRMWIDNIDYKGKDAEGRGDFREALINRAQAAMLYFKNQDYYHAANSADRAANASYRLQLKAMDKEKELTIIERELVSSSAYLSELAGNCYLEIGERENAVFAYLKAAKEYIFGFNDVKKTEEMLERARGLDVGINALIKNKTAMKMYVDTMSRMKSLRLIFKS